MHRVVYIGDTIRQPDNKNGDIGISYYINNNTNHEKCMLIFTIHNCSYFETNIKLYKLIIEEKGSFS